MPIPYVYKRVARRLHPHKKIFTSLTVAGFVIWTVSVFYLDFPNILSAIGIIFFMWPWGLYLIVLWYGDAKKPGRIGRKIRLKYPRLYQRHLGFGKILEWPGALMLAFWFWFSIGMATSLLRATLEGN